MSCQALPLRYPDCSSGSKSFPELKTSTPRKTRSLDAPGSYKSAVHPSYHCPGGVNVYYPRRNYRVDIQSPNTTFSVFRTNCFQWKHCCPPLISLKLLYPVLSTGGLSRGFSDYLIYVEPSQRLFGADFAVLLSALKNCEIISDCVGETGRNIYTTSVAAPGTYDIFIGLSFIARIYVTKFERRHEGHEGFFVSGYPYFVCGDRRKVKVPWRVVTSGVLRSRRFLVTRSYSFDCASINIDKIYSRPDLPKYVIASDMELSQYRLSWSSNDSDDAVVPDAKPLTVSDSKDHVVSTAENTSETKQMKFPSVKSKLICTSPGNKSEFPFVCCESEEQQRLAGCRGKQAMAKLQTLSAFVFDSESLGVVSSSGSSEGIVIERHLCGNCFNSSSLQNEHRVRKYRYSETSSWSDCQDVTKYFNQRYRYMHRFDEGIILDEESWFSVCPEEISKHIAARVCSLYSFHGSQRKLVVMDGFCGAGGNIIQLALMDEIRTVYAVDIDGKKLEMARRNAEVYGVLHKIHFIKRSFLDLDTDDMVDIDAMVFSPPWGGPEYQCQERYDVKCISPTFDSIISVCLKFTKNLAILLPRNICLDQMQQFGLHFEVEQNFLNDKLKTCTVYYGDLVATE